ncbi:MAG: SIS domain-containing protein [candidate division WOR-3 bacterium]|nr:SIS domain-containing protein [candidate division WOR-3 bacterium]MCX7947531.1 SIS domain-containing protein [candidate division WOR-3 bacterium]MDW8150417.1 SIS domain-containing protein [candidate division WOR-3 bacterium]
MEKYIKSVEELKSLIPWLLEIKDSLFFMIDELKLSILENRKILICGNGGSAAESLHFSSELLGKFKNIRKPIPAISLTSDIPTITAISNDFSFEEIFSRQIEALGNSGDFLFAFSTSGKSKNVNLAVKKAYEKNMKIVYFTGIDGTEVENICNYIFKVPSKDTARIQEIHLFLIHSICQELENL